MQPKNHSFLLLKKVQTKTKFWFMREPLKDRNRLEYIITSIDYIQDFIRWIQKLFGMLFTMTFKHYVVKW